MQRCLRHACGLVFSWLLGPLPAHAISWIGSNGDAFNATSSWGGAVPSGANSTAEFGGNTGGVIIQLNHAVGTFYFNSSYTSGGFIVRNGGSLSLINGIVNDSAVSPEFTIRDGTVFFTGNAPKLGNATFNVESAGLLKLFTANHPNGSAARVNLTGGQIGMNNTTDGGSASLGEMKGTSGRISLPDVALTVGALNTDATYSGTIDSLGALTKVGTGTWTLTGANTYDGSTLISAGTIKIDNASGSAFGTGNVTIGIGGTLTGAGSFTGALENNGVYAPGNSPELALHSSFSQGATGILEMEIAGLTRGIGYDALNVSGALTFGGSLQLSLIDGFDAASLTIGDTFNLFDWGSASGTFSFLDLPDLSAHGLTWDISALYTTGELGVSAIPEPSTYAMLAGAAAMVFAAWRGRRGRSGRAEIMR
ncbi:MAG TPA: autotransporter-associated beta strand repeat-containing protein [Opitutus sp.]|nr:autotransporter-associated beta strand repeat-containing protein [Opitutus sp.]